MRRTFWGGTTRGMTLGLILSACLMTSIVSPTPTYAGELADVSMPDTIEVGDHTLVLNGMGLRKKAIIKVYVAGLYLPSRMNETKAILGVDAPRRVVMEFKFGVSKERMCGAWEDGLKANVPDAGQEVRHAFETLCSWMDDLEKGDQMVFTYLPGEGMRVKVKGVDKGALPAGRAAADAVFSTWIGPSPPSADFKEGLLGN